MEELLSPAGILIIAFVVWQSIKEGLLPVPISKHNNFIEEIAQSVEDNWKTFSSKSQNEASLKGLINEYELENYIAARFNEQRIHRLEAQSIKREVLKKLDASQHLRKVSIRYDVGKCFDRLIASYDQRPKLWAR